MLAEAWKMLGSLGLLSYASAMMMKSTCSANPLFPGGGRQTLGAEFSLNLLTPSSLRVKISREINIDSAYISKLPANLQIGELISVCFYMLLRFCGCLLHSNFIIIANLYTFHIPFTQEEKIKNHY